MSTSASERNKKGQKNLTLFKISDTGYSSEHGLFNSSGQLLKGNELFEKYSDLAKQLDTKRSAFYLQLKENEIIFGCSLIVKTANGREERVVFIQIYENLSSGYKIESNIELLKRFYDSVKSEIENFELKKYQLIGLWNEGDFLNIKEVEIERGLKYTSGKISAGKKVFVKISELSSGLTLVLELIALLKKNIPLIFDVSQFPSESDVSVSLIKPNPDFEIGENGNLQNFVISESWLHFEKLGETLYKKRSNSKGGQNRSPYISSIVQMITDEPKDYLDPSNPIFNNYDDGEKIEIFTGLIQKLNKRNYNDIRKVLINIYGKIAVSKSKKEIHKILLSNDIYIDELLKDLVIKEMYEKHNKDLFDVLFNDNTSPDNFVITYSDKMSEELDEQQTSKVSGQTDDKMEKIQKLKASDKMYDEWKGEQQKKKATKNSSADFEKRVKDILKNLESSQKTKFIKFIAQESRSKPEEKGKILLSMLVSDLARQDVKKLISELNDEELEKIDEILGTYYQSTKKEQNKVKRNWIIGKAFRAGILIGFILVALFSYNFLIGFFPKGDDGAISSLSSNQTNNSELDVNGSNTADKNLVSDDQTNNSDLNESGSSTAGKNLPSANQTNDSELNVNGSSIADKNLVSANQTNNSALNESGASTAGKNSASANQTNNSTSK